MITYKLNKKGLLIVEKQGMYFPFTQDEIDEMRKIFDKVKPLVSGPLGVGT